MLCMEISLKNLDLTKKSLLQLQKLITETLERSSMVVEGLRGVVKYSNRKFL